MPKQEPQKSKSQEKINLAIIKTDINSPIQEVICRKEHKKLFEDLCKKQKKP